MQIDHFKEMTPVFYNQHGIKSFYRAANFRLHWHDRFELLYVIQGELQVKIDKKDFFVKPENLVIFPPRTLHSGKKSHREPHII